MTSITHIIKKNKTMVEFDETKITQAVMKAMNNVPPYTPDEKAAERVKNRVIKKLKLWDTQTPNVDQIHILVENSLMDAKLHDVAREYITYRDANKPNIFRKRVEIEPAEYPHLLEFKDAVQHSYWLFSHFNYTSDMQDMSVKMKPHEVTAATRAMLAISQIENSVKTFWGRIDMRLPKPEISAVGAVFAESEVRHGDAYKQGLIQHGLEDEFKNITKVPAVGKRIKYLEKVNANMRSADNQEFFEALILFSIFIENVSLFSQFVILMGFRKHQNRLKGISNAVEATSKEERIHAEFGFELVNIIKQENPDWFDNEMKERIQDLAVEAFEAEKDIVGWIYEEGDLDFLPKDSVIDYIKAKLNISLETMGVQPVYPEIDMKAIAKEFEWFNDELHGTKIVDFFNTQSINYGEGMQTFDAESLFDD